MTRLGDSSSSQALPLDGQLAKDLVGLEETVNPG
jgi:hypothetical protein